MHSLRKITPITALVAGAAAAAALALAPPAGASTQHRPAPAPASHRTAKHLAKPHPAPKHPARPTVSAKSVPGIRAAQRKLAAAHRSAPRFDVAAATTFTVNTTEDSDLATTGGTTCVDAASGGCSLRAAVDAANNLATPVTIALSVADYKLTTGTALTVTNPAGTSIVGKGASGTSITGDGSGVFVISAAASAAPGLLFLTSATVTGGSATNGGGVFLDDTSTGAGLVLNHAAITGNTATTEGGGIAASDYGTIYARASKITNNIAPKGAGIYEYWSDVQLVECTVTGNATTPGAAGSGGGLYDEYGVVSVTGGSISSNVAGDPSNSGSGAGVYNYYATLTTSDVTISNNVAQGGGAGGALYAYYDVSDITGGEMSNNVATGTNGSGGAVYVAYGSQAGLHGVTMTGNTVPDSAAEGYGGGAVFDYGYYYGNQLTIDSGTTITGSDASAVYLYTYYGNVDLTLDHATLTGNDSASSNGLSAQGCGGAICAYDYYYGSTNISITSSNISGNTSSGNGSAGAVTVWAYEYAQSTTTARSTTFSGNVSGVKGAGGAIGVEPYSTDYTPQSLRLYSDKFSNNSAGSGAANSQGNGGAVALGEYAVLNDHGSTFSGNQAIGDGAFGGAVYDLSYQSASYAGTVFSGNKAGANATGYGGALYTQDESGDSFSTVTMSGNSAAYGGAVYADTDAYELTFVRSTISGNKSTGSSTNSGFGGGVYADDALVTLENSTVSGNVASGTTGVGGGIYQSGSKLGVRYSTVSGNVAAVGGGVYTDGEGGTLLGSIVSDNRASAGGAEADCGAASGTSTLNSIGGNVLGQSACVAGTQSSDIVTAVPHLHALASNGGPTQTMRPTATSPAVGRSTYNCPATDQRGQVRSSSKCDAGAYQTAPAKVRSLSPTKGRAGDLVTLTGSGFTFANHAVFGKVPSTLAVISDTTMRVRAPKGVTGTVLVTVTSPDGGSSVGKFTYIG